MSNRHTKVQAQKNKNGDALITAQQTTTDAPLIPIDEIERLHQLDPAWGQFILDQTKIEADHRRNLQNENSRRQDRVNGYILIERLLGSIFAFLLGIIGTGAGAALVYFGHDWAGVSLASVTIGTLAVTFVYKQHRSQQQVTKSTN